MKAPVSDVMSVVRVIADADADAVGREVPAAEPEYVAAELEAEARLLSVSHVEAASGGSDATAGIVTPSADDIVEINPGVAGKLCQRQLLAPFVVPFS